jgi:hypothetical protein
MRNLFGLNLFAPVLVTLLALGCGKAGQLTSDSSSASAEAPVQQGAAEKSEQDLYLKISAEAGASVDKLKGFSRPELLTSRKPSSQAPIDSCWPGAKNHKNFADVIAWSVSSQLVKPVKSPLGTYLSDLFGVRPERNQNTGVSLTSHALCKLTMESLEHGITAKRLPSEAVMAKANRFISQVNTERAAWLKGNNAAGERLQKRWSRFMMCLSYVESLSTADRASSINVGKKYSPAGFVRPPGVNFYEDPLQTEESRLNIGLYQFTPDARGNIGPCNRQWSEERPTCALKSDQMYQAEMIRAVGSNMQTFNAFCGVNKIIQMFYVQVNTNKPASSPLDNRRADGSLKPAGERCVTLQFAGKAGNHFGPFQNTSGANLDELMGCAVLD